jgi:hypothetical protein
MSKIESEVKPIIYSMLSGDRITLTVEEQEVIVRWASLKIMVLDLSDPKYAVVTRRDCAEFMSMRKTKTKFTIYVGRCIVPSWQVNLLKFSATISKNPAIKTTSPKNIQTTTFGFGGLLFYCIAHRVPSSIDLADISFADPRLPAFPSDQAILWPPEKPLGEGQVKTVAYSLVDFMDKPYVKWARQSM